MNAETKICQNCRQNFVVEPEDFDFYKKMGVPPPTFCPKCRAIRRMIFLNYSNLYRKKDAKTGEVIFSTYPEDSFVKIYERDYWWSDAWDPMEYGKEIDFSRPFLEQVSELSREVPWANKSVRGMVNSDYCNQASYLKNCYLCINVGNSENCLYCNFSLYIKDTIDSHALMNSELCYEIYQGEKDFQCFFCSNIETSRNVWFSRDLSDCSDCFGCVNLRHKKYCIFNEQYSKEDYEQKIKEFNTGSFSSVQEIKKKLQELYLKSPHKYLHGLHNDNVSGDYVYYSKNARNVFETDGLENVRYSENLVKSVKDSYDYTNWGENSELIYESVSCGDNCRNTKFCFDCWPTVSDSEYSMNCHSSANLFGCVGLKKKQYCILNRQYSKEEYETLVGKIKKHMDEMPYTDKKGCVYKYGEFFPDEFSPLAYNETMALDYHPKTKEEAIAAGYPWRDPDEKEYKFTMSTDNLPDHINDVPDEITKEIIQCTSCKRAYRILDRELVFYRRFSIPLPRLCHYCRYTKRLSFRNINKLYKRNCQCIGTVSENKVYSNLAPHPHGAERCPNEFETTYASERPEIIYCESCYNSEVA